MTWRSKLSIGGLLGLLFIGFVVVVDAWLLDRLFPDSIRSQQIGLVTFLMSAAVLLSVPVLVFLVYQTLSWLTLRYRLDRNGLVVNWLGTEQKIPIRDIQHVVPGNRLGSTIVGRRGVRWPGHERGEGMVPGIGQTRFLATRPLADQLLLLTPRQAFAISPNNPQGFLDALAARQELGPNRLLKPGAHHARWLSWPLWKDQTAWVLLGAGIILNLALFGYLSARFPGLDAQLPLHFNNQGLVDRIGIKIELFTLPIIGLIILSANTILGLLLYKSERTGSYFLWGSATVVQALFWLAVFSIGL